MIPQSIYGGPRVTCITAIKRNANVGTMENVKQSHSQEIIMVEKQRKVEIKMKLTG